MDSIGAIRRVDEIGRIVIPKEIRNGLKIKPGDCLEIFSDGNNIYIRKKELIKSSIDTLDNFFKSIASILNIAIIITDTGKYLYNAGKEYKSIVDKTIDEKIYNNIMKRKTTIINDYEFHNNKINIIIEPIIVNGDILGSILLINTKSIISEKFEIISKIMAKMIINYIEL